MNKKQTTVIALIAAATMTSIFVLGAINLNGADALKPTDSSVGTKELLIGRAGKIIVDIESPYGFETITSFKLFQTDNLMKQSGFYTLRLFGPIVYDKGTLLNWIANDMGKLPDGYTIVMPITTGGNKPAVMTKAAAGATTTVIPMTGKIKLQVLDGSEDMFATQILRQLEFSGCHVAGYTMGTNYDDEKEYFRDGLQHFEEVDFACTSIKDLHSESMNNRGYVVERAIGDEGREIVNEKGELVTAREYRQPIVMESFKNAEELKPLKKEIVSRVELDGSHYKVGQTATFTVRFADLEGYALEPDKVTAFYNGQMVGLEKQDVGTYTFTTPSLTKANHQLIVSAEKDGYAADTTYLSLTTDRIG